MIKYLLISISVLIFGCDSPQAEQRATPTEETTETDQASADADAEVNFDTPADASTVNPYLPVEETEEEIAAREEEEEEEVIEDEPKKPETIEIYEKFDPINNDHDFVKDPNSNDVGFFRVFKDMQPNTVPLFRCYIPALTNHFITSQGGCEGGDFQQIEMYGFVYSDKEKGTPLRRCFNGDDHTVTTGATSAADCTNAGFNAEGVMGSFPDP